MIISRFTTALRTCRLFALSIPPSQDPDPRVRQAVPAQPSSLHTSNFTTLSCHRCRQSLHRHCACSRHHVTRRPSARGSYVFSNAISGRTAAEGPLCRPLSGGCLEFSRAVKIMALMFHQRPGGSQSGESVLWRMRQTGGVLCTFNSFRVRGQSEAPGRPSTRRALKQLALRGMGGGGGALVEGKSGELAEAVLMGE